MKCKRCHTESKFLAYGYCKQCYRAFLWWREHDLEMKVQNAETMSIFRPHGVWWSKSAASVDVAGV